MSVIHKTVAARNRGATFCHVARIRQEIQGNPVITLGNQKWNGKSPILIVRPNKRTITESQDCGREGSQVKEVEDLIRLPKTRSLDPRACTIKYLTADSLSEALFW